MFKKFLYVLFWTSLALSLKVHSATYYISSIGNDANDGLTETSPWQTIDKMNSVEFADNDTILFKRGEVFRGTMSLLKSPIGITISAYGTGANPKIAGSVEITGWTKTTHPDLDSNVVYEADVSGLPLTADGIHHLFVNEQLMTIARYPNVDSPDKTNWLKVGATAGTNGFTDPALVAYGKVDGYWVGATLRIRNYSWTYMVTEVTGYTASNGKITASRLNNQLPEWGYFLDNKLEELDHPGEWYYDAGTKKVYLYPKGGINPNTSLIEGSTYGTGIKIGSKDDTTIENLSFHHFTQKGVHIGANNCIVRNNHFEHNTVGLTTWNPVNATITSNTFNHQFKNSIGLSASSGFDVQNSVVEKNTITNTAMYPIYGARYDGIYGGLAISVFGKAYTVRQNTISNTSWTGIYLKDDGHHLIENNVIRNSLLLLNDGGAVSIGSNGNRIRGNFLLNSVGNVDESNGCGDVNKTPCMHHPSYGMGIGADQNFKDHIIEGNTVANNTHQGIRLNSFINTVVRNNVVYNNDENQIVVEDKKGPSYNNVVENNTIYPLSPEQNGLALTKMTEHGTFDNNYYCNPYSELVLIRDKKRYTLAHWQSAFPSYEQNSRWCYGMTAEEYSVSNVGTNLFVNSTFDTDVSNWKGSIFHDTTQTQMDGGSLKLVNSGTGSANVSPNVFALTTGQYYRLKFSVIGNGFGRIRLRINNIASGTDILAQRFFAYDPNRKDYEMFFQSPVTTSSGKMLFATTQDDADTYWLDNVTFEPVTVALNDATQQSPLFMNQTAQSKTISLGGTTYYDLDGKPVTGSITLAPFSSQILVTSAPPPPPPVTMTISHLGNGSGTVTAPVGVGSGINCGTTCTETYAYGTPLTLTATPNTGSVFTGWTGAGCLENVTITTDMNCTANFALSNYTLSLNKAGNGFGTISSVGINCGTDCTESYVNGTAVNLIITPDTNSTFTGWTETGCADNLAITSDMSCTANFALLNYSLTVNKAGTGSGTVSSTGIDCGVDCAESYVSGTAVTLTATQATDSIFTGWTGTNCADSFNITADMNCTATFDLIPASPVNYTLTVNQAGTGSGTVSSTGIDCGADCSESYVSGTAVTLTATQAADSIFTGWTGTNCADSFNITADMNCTATFDLMPVLPVNYSLTVNKAGTGSGTVSSTGIDCGADCAENYVSGTAITLTATPAADSIFTGWTGTNCAESFNITTDMNCTATFDLIPASAVNYTLTVNQAGTGNGTVSSTGIDCGVDCAESYINGTAVTLTATPTADSIFAGWTGTNCADSFNIITDMSCTATFDLSLSTPALPSYALMVNTVGSGEIISNPTGIACGTNCIRYYVSGTMVTLTAIPDNGMNFTGWTGACSGSDDSTPVFVNSEKTCTAQFEPVEISPILDTSVTYPLTFTTIGDGIITSEPAGITCGENCSANYTTDTIVTLSVNLLDGLVQFVGFSGDADCFDGSITMNQPVNCVATFETFDTGTEIPNDNLEENTTDNGTNTPVDGNGENTTDNGTNTPVNNNENSELPPTPGNYRLTMTTMGNGIVNSEPVGMTCGEDCLEDYSKETVVTFTATLLDDNTQFIGFSGDADCSDGLVTMNQSLDCIAIFEPITVISDEVTETASEIVESDNEVSISPITLPMNYFLTITRIGNGYVSSTPAGILCGNDCIANYPSDTMVNFTVGLEANTQFLGFTGDPDCSDGVVTLTKPTHCIATFQALNPGYIQFAAAEYNISEEAEQLIVTVKRLEGNEGTVIVNYATKDNTAIAGHDYVESWGTLKWEDGDQSDRILTIPLLDNEENDGDKTFTLALFGFSGNQVTVTIWDNEMLVTEPVEANEQTCPTSDLVDGVCNAQGQTLSNLRIAQAGQLENAVLEGNVINNGWISNATIQADTTLSGGIVSGYIANQGIMENFEFRGARVRGGTLRGLITNTQDGTIEEVLLAAQTEISGGQVAGHIRGEAPAQAQLNNLTVQAGTTLSHVIIGDNVQVPSDVNLGRGVRFANRQPIPTELELINVLPVLPQLTCVEQGTMPEPVDLRADVWQPSEGILPHINKLPALIDNGWEITQDDPYGYLQLTIAEWHYAVQPMSIKYSTAPANLQVQDNQSTRFLIDGGLDILTQPAVQSPCDLLVALEKMGLSNLMGQTNGNLKIPASDNSWYSARPHFASVALTTDTEPGLYLSESPIVRMGLVAALVFIDEEGLRRQQMFYPGFAVPEALYASAQEVVIEPYGLVNFKLDGQSYRGVVDYLVTPSSLPVPEKVQIIPLSDINQDGTADFALLYPTGEQQTVLVIP